MTVVAYEEEETGRPEISAVTYRFFDTGGLDIIRLGDYVTEDHAAWPEPSPRPTTSESAAALERRSAPDPEPRLAELEINDGLGL